MKEQIAQDSQPAPTQPSSPAPASKPARKFPMLYIAIFLVLVIALLAVWAVGFKSNTPGTKDSVEYVTGLPKESVVIQLPQDEDIQRYPLSEITVASLNVYLNTFEGLTVYRGTNNLEPGLAESWTNPNPTTWRIKLREGVKFQSSDTFTAKDVKYTIEQAKASENAEIPWFSQAMAARVDSVTIIDDYTVDLKTKEPDATLISWLVYVGIVSEDQVKRDGLEKAVGTGPYKLVSLSKSDASLEANSQYWGGEPKVKKLAYKVIHDPEAAKEALNNGSVDIIWLSSANNSDLTKGLYSSEYRTGGIDNYVAFDLTSTKTPYVNTETNPFKDSRVRKAIYLALDIPKLISNAGVNAEPLSQFATRELVGYNPQLKAPTQDLSEARRLLADAGLPNGFSVTLDTDQQTSNVKVAEEMKKQLAEIGIIVTVNSPETEVFYERIDKKDFSMLLSFYYPDTLDSVDLIDTLFHTVSGSHGLWNVSNYSNPDLDKTLNQATSSFETETRIGVTHQAHELIMEDLPSIPLYTNKYQIIARDDLSFKPSINMILNGFDISGRREMQSN